jgi:hypothetical protein
LPHRPGLKPSLETCSRNVVIEMSGKERGREMGGRREREKMKNKEEEEGERKKEKKKGRGKGRRKRRERDGGE